MALAGDVPTNLQREGIVPTIVKLWELDYNKLLGSAMGNPTNMRFYVSDIRPILPATPVTLNGQQYDPLPIDEKGFDYSADGKQPRPKIRIANGDGQISAILDLLVAGDISGAQVRRRRIFRKHLDDGDDPDSSAEWPSDVWLIERKISETRFAIDFELSSLSDVSGVELPLGRVEPDLCRWVYLSTECGWDNTISGEPMFDKDENFLGISSGTPPGAEFCARHRRSCALRFADRGENVVPESSRNVRPVRFGGFPGAIRTLKMRR